MDNIVANRIAERFASLPPKERRLFVEKMREQGVTAAHLPILARGVPGGRYALSYAQQRLWFLWKLQPQSTAYHITGGMRLHGDLDVDALRASFDAVVARQGSLRTTFTEDADGTAQQVLHESLACEYRFEDLGAHADREAEAAAWADVLGSRAFDLETGPLLRIGVMRLSAREHVLVVVMHHIISDGGSVDVLLREFVANYRARVTGATGNEDSLPALQIQYVDYAVWQRQWLEAGEQERQLSYWREQLGGEQPVLALPVDHPRRALAGYSAASYVLQLPAELGAQVRGFAQQRGATPFMVLLGAFQALLHRYTGQQDIRVGVPVANRERMEVEPLIGFFVNMQVLRAQIDGETELSALLAQVKQAALGAQAHRDLPFDVLVEALQPERSLSHTPLFQVVLNHQKEDYGMLAQLPGLSVEGFGAQGRAAQFELTLNTVEAADGTLSGSLAYARELFDASTMERFGAHFVTMLAALVRTPQRSVSEVALVDGEERAALLKLGRGAKAEGNLFTPVHERISEQSRKQPDAVAVVFGEQRISYSELEQQANRLAHRLIKLGVGPEVRVGIAVERSVEMVVGLLSILKAGGAYVPLDPEYPAERLTYMLEDSGVTLLLTQSRIGRTLPVAENVRVVEIDTEEVAGESTEAPHVMVKSDNLAYVIYTSGSTGRPKGAQLTHRNVSRLLDATRHWFDFGPADVWTMFHSYAFDFSVWEMFGALCHGGRLVVVPFMVSRAPEAFLALLRAEKVTVLNQTPSAFRQLMHLPQLYEGADLSLRVVIFGGEALEPQTLKPWIDRFGDARPQLVNMYGITETTVHVTYRPVLAADLDSGSSPVGAAIPDLDVYVLDASLNLVPRSVMGELYVGGAGVARGYLKRAALTAQRFVPDPFSHDGGRLYRTGDLARWNAQGELEYLGRIDHQVKVRGFRIELGEIEAQLLAQPGVREALVITRDGAGGARLVAYVTSAAGHTPDVAHLRIALGATLPEYMVPSAIVALDTLPLTPNGKVDRNALPEPEFASAGYEAPNGEIECAIAGIWQHVLGIEQVGRQDNFFELGGHSLLLMQIASRIQQRFSIDMQIQDLYANPTIGALAPCVARASRHQTRPIAPRAAGQTVVPLSYAQERLWFLWKLDPRSAAYNLAGARLLEGDLNVDAARAAVLTIVERHEILRSRFTEIDGVPFQEIGEAAFDWSEHDLRDVPNAQRDTAVDTLLRTLSQKPFDLEHGPALRLSLIRLGDTSSVLHFGMHHIVSDAWSSTILLREFARAYEALCHQHPLRDDELPVQYADYALWQRERLTDEQIGRQLAYWRERLGSEHPVLELPVSRKRTGLRAAGGGRVIKALSARQSESLRKLSLRHGTTPFVVLMAAYVVLLSRYSGQNDIRIGVPVAGRDRLETEALIGFFVNTLVLRSELSGVADFRALVDQVNTRMAEAQSHQDLPFARIVDALQPERSLSHTPLFQAMFNYQSASREEISLPGLAIRGLQSRSDTARFDLVLNATDDLAFALSLTYATDIFDAPVVQRLLDHYIEILDQVCTLDNPHLGEIVLNGARRREPARCDHAFDPVARRIGEQARVSPHAPALHCEGQRLSYAELDGWANRLARRLNRLGVRADERVGVCMQRAPGLVAALLGVMKSGGAFVPLDPEYPEDRLAYMIEDAGVKRVLVDDLTSAGLGTLLEGLETLRVDAVDDESPEPFDRPVHPDQLAYVIYTSGSTGRPKGVGISQRSLSLHLDDFLQTYGITSNDKQLQSSTVNFDVALHEMLPALMRGGQIEMRGPQLWDLETTSRHLADEHVTFSRIPTAYWQQWLRDPPAAARLAHLRQITVGGEGLPGDALRQWREGPLGHIRLDNLYGPTETTVACMYRETTADDVNQPVVSIGRPYPSRSVYVLDGNGNEAPVGALGELCIGGETLARGYLNRAAQTAEKFIPDPFRTDGGRLYRTGDLCRRREDGTIDFLGRMDQQVKLRGFRIELGEIESALRQVEGVREAAVELRGDGDAKRLVGYVAGTAGEAEVRRGIEGVLPGYMVPSAFVMLERLPVMPNGKVDRKALPEPVAASQSYEAPQGEVEEALARIWCEVLGVERIGRFDNFFEIGGHSLAAIRVSHLAEMRGVNGLTLEALFSHPSVAALADCIRQHAHRPAIIVPLNQSAAPCNLFALHPLYGLVAEYRPLAGRLADVVNVYGVQSPHYTDPSWWPTTLDEVAETYADAILAVQPDGGFNLLGWSLGGILAVEVAASLERRGHTVESIALVDAGPPDEIVASDALQSRSLMQDEYSDADTTHLRKFLDEEADWREFLPEENTDALLQRIALVSNHFEALTRARCAQRLNVLPRRWRALRSEDPSSRANDRWKRYLVEELAEASVIDSTHEDILDNPQFVGQFRDFLRLTAPSISSSDLTTES